MDKDERKELCINDDYSYSVQLKRLRRTAVFSELCKDDNYPCASCTRCKSPVMCCYTYECAEWANWFYRTWKNIRRKAGRR